MMTVHALRLLLVAGACAWHVDALSNGAVLESQVRERVEMALNSVRSILNNTRHPQYPAEVPHTYHDKYILAEFATKAIAAGVINVIEVLAPGWWDRNREQLFEWSSRRAVTLRFSACERCAFKQSLTKELSDGTKQVTSTGWVSSTVETVTKVQEHHWTFVATWNASVFPGVDQPAQVALFSNEGRYAIKTVTAAGEAAKAPRKDVRCQHHDMDLSWLFSRLRSGKLDFVVNRTASKTPRRNQEVEDALLFTQKLSRWAWATSNYFHSALFPVQEDHNFDVDGIFREGVFSPVVGLFVLEPQGAAQHMVLADDFDAVLWEHRRNLQQRLHQIAELFPHGTASSTGLVTVAAAQVVAAMQHLQELTWDYEAVVSDIERMLRDQLIAAVGRELSPTDFAEYMDFHSMRLFRKEHVPKRFSYAVRRPGRSPEGTVSVEGLQEVRLSGSGDGRAGASPILALSVRRREDYELKPLRVGLDAAVDVTLIGERYLHAFVLHQFSSQPPRAMRLVARARQFSSFLLLVGHVAPGSRFEPMAALIVKNRDDLSIPLMLESMPTPKEFRDAIESMSPEQQAFAKAFREMQLSNTLFAVTIIQIKPQLELLLNLPPDSLTKEIQLTQDLMDLFIRYQVPPDLLSYDDDVDAPAKVKLTAVKEHVASLLSTINASQQRELDEARGQAQKRKLENEACAAHTKDVEKTLDFAAVGSSLSIRRFSRMGSSIPMERMARAAPQLKKKSVLREAVQPAVKMMSSTANAEPPRPTASPVPKPLASAQQSDDQAERVEDAGEVDDALLPQHLDAQMMAHDMDAALRPSKLQLGPTWQKKEQSGLLSPLQLRQLHEEDQRSERNAAFDLLDALSRSGALPVRYASLHLILAATHRFDETLVDTVVKGNVNPIEMVERSLLIMASAVQGCPAAKLVADGHLERLAAGLPSLFNSSASTALQA